MVPTIELPEAELLRCRSPAYVERLVRDCSPWMFGLARRILNDDAEAEDAVQDAFMSAFRAAPRFDGHSKVTTWLHRITVNAALMRRRSRKRRAIGTERAAAEDSWAVRRLVAHDPRSSSTERTLRVVRAAVESLPGAYRLAVILRDIEGIGMEEVASLVGMTLNGAKTRLHRGRTLLREKLLPLWEEEAFA